MGFHIADRNVFDVAAVGWGWIVSGVIKAHFFALPEIMIAE
jgi:hypothetical protein